MNRDESRVLLDKFVELAREFSHDIGSLEARVMYLEREVERLRENEKHPPSELAAVEIERSKERAEEAKASKEWGGAAKAIASAGAKLVAAGGVGAAVVKFIEWIKEALSK